MKTLALFNNKGGVGKTTLTYHLSHMLAKKGINTLVVDMDPQANLTSAFLTEQQLEKLWDEGTKTVLSAVSPILEGTGDFSPVTPIEINSHLFLIAGDLGLSRYEDRLSESWPKGFAGEPAALRATTAFYRMVLHAAQQVKADAVLLDVGPNLGAINRSTLLCADFLLIPLAADLFSLQGLRNLGPSVRTWKKQWTKIVAEENALNFRLPPGGMEPIGYVVLQHAVRLDRPIKAYARWLQRIPAEYRRSVLDQPNGFAPASSTDDSLCLATLRNYRSLMPMAQDARKPMFDLRAADGAIGSHASLVQTCYTEFDVLASKVIAACKFRKSPS